MTAPGTGTSTQHLGRDRALGDVACHRSSILSASGCCKANHRENNRHVDQGVAALPFPTRATLDRSMGPDTMPSSPMEGICGHQAAKVVPDRSGSLSNVGKGSTGNHQGNKGRPETSGGNSLGTGSKQWPNPTPVRKLETPRMDSLEPVSGAMKNRHRLENKRRRIIAQAAQP